MFSQLIGFGPTLATIAVAVIAAVGWGFIKGKSAAREKAVKRRLASIEQAQKIEKEMDNADRDTVVDINTRP